MPTFTEEAKAMSNFFLTPAAIPEDVKIACLPEKANPLRAKPTKHRFNRAKNPDGSYKHPLLDSTLITYDYPGDGEALRYTSKDIPEGKDKPIKDFTARELKPGLTKYDANAWEYKITRTWNYYHRPEAQKYAVGKIGVLAEGENDTDAIREYLGIVAISPQGGHWSTERLKALMQQAKDDGLAVILQWGDDDSKGVEKIADVKYACASVGMPHVTLNCKRFWTDLPEWKPDKKTGKLEGSGYGARDFFKTNKLTDAELIDEFEKQVKEAAELQKIVPEVIGYKGKYSPSFKEKPEYKATVTPEELAARKARISKGDYQLFDFLPKYLRDKIKEGTNAGQRTDGYVNVVYGLFESYNFLLSEGIETVDTPEQYFREWLKNSHLSPGDETYDKAYKHFNNSSNKIWSSKDETRILKILDGKVEETEELPPEQFEILPFAPRTSPKVLSNPKADDFYNRGLTSLKSCQDENFLPLVICTGKANGELLAEYGYLVAVLPDVELSDKEKNIYGFSWDGWEQLKPFLFYQDAKGKQRSNCRDVYFVDNSTKTTENDTLRRVTRLVIEAKCNVFVIPDKTIFSQGIEAFHDAYADALSFVDWFSVKLTTLRRKPDLVLGGDFFPEELIQFPKGNKNAVFVGFYGTGKTYQLKAQVRHNTEEEYFSVVVVARKSLQNNLGNEHKLNLPTIEQLDRTQGEFKGFGKNLGCVLCMDSIVKMKRLLKQLGYLDSDSPKFRKFRLIIEECEQTLFHYALGTDTHIAKIRPLAVEAFSEIIIQADHCLRCDADASQITADYITDLRPFEDYIVQHPKTARGRSITVWDGITPIEMVHLGIGKNITARTDSAIMLQTLSGKDESKWIPENVEKVIECYTSDRIVSRFDSDTISNPIHENYNLLADADSQSSKLDRNLTELSNQKGIGIANSVFSTGISIEANFDIDAHIAPAVGSPLDVIQKLHRVRQADKETHLWIQYANNRTTCIFDSIIPSDIKRFIIDADTRIRLNFAGKGDVIENIPFNEHFENLKCRLAARQNFFSKNFKAATLAILKHKWEYTIVGKDDYIECHSGNHSDWNYDDNEVSDYNLSESELKKVAREISKEHIQRVNTRIAELPVIDNAEFDMLSRKFNRTKSEEELLIRKTFDNEYEGSIECSADAIKDYKDFKHIKLQNQFYFLNPELAHIKNIVEVEKSVQEGKRVRDCKLLRVEGVDYLRDIGFKQFFDEMYTLKGKDAVPFEGIKRIPAREFKWFTKKITVDLGYGRSEDRYVLDLTNPAWSTLIKMLGGLSLQKQCRPLFGFNAKAGKKGVVIYSTVRDFLKNYWIDLKINGSKDNSYYYFTLEADRDLYFQVLDKRHNLPMGESRYLDMAINFGEGYSKPITTTGKHIEQVYKAGNIEETLLEAIAKSKAKGLPKEKPVLFVSQESKQLDMMAFLKHSAKAEAARKQLEAMKNQKQSSIPDEENTPLVGDFGLANGKIVKVISTIQIEIGNYTSEGLLVEDRKRRREKISKDALQPASVDVLANYVNTKLVKYPDDQNRFLETVKEALPDKYNAVMSKIAVAA